MTYCQVEGKKVCALFLLHNSIENTGDMSLIKANYGWGVFRLYKQVKKSKKHYQLDKYNTE